MKLKRFLAGAALAVAGIFAPAVVMAEDGTAATSSVTIPDVGVDMASMISGMLDKLGPVIIVAVGATIGFIVLKVGIKWAQRAVSK